MHNQVQNYFDADHMIVIRTFLKHPLRVDPSTSVRMIITRVLALRPMALPGTPERAAEIRDSNWKHRTDTLRALSIQMRYAPKSARSIEISGRA